VQLLWWKWSSSSTRFAAWPTSRSTSWTLDFILDLLYNLNWPSSCILKLLYYGGRDAGG
jgi:hypothetical protein